MVAGKDEEASPPAVAAPVGTTPTPDPTVLTTQNLRREIAGLRELLEARIIPLEALAGRLQDLVDERPAAINFELAHLQKLMDEKFIGVAKEFAGRDTALAAALLAQKTSVEDQNKSNALATAKSDSAVTKQIDGIGTLIATNNEATAGKIDDIKQRLTLIEGQKSGGQGLGLLIFSVVGAAAGIAGIIGLILVIARGA